MPKYERAQCHWCGENHSLPDQRRTMLTRFYHSHAERFWMAIMALAIFGFMGIVHAIIDAHRPGGCANGPLTIMACLR